ncbi:hypothetical protein BGW36DRAFT_366971 [Talaromyces proteolyticus]|uniref:Metallo-beta-lactamase domain-containing protein n=1 Tax=Talaromyces proteolyticus TaxID=1131652 RepID=A0AAD4L074_9EURO|nr:uncharacterized protein BGW36DRAFT_366971 [Talaromyces proteolyticus]KAH8705153.1 hypothetical protein BGW36DRAFT_366971 [Talaromyces proteolyticus]
MITLGGLEELVEEVPDLPIYISRGHWQAFGEHPFLASIEGANPNHWPKSFSPQLVDYEDKPVGPWKKSYQVTSDGKIVLVDTSGHVPGHLAIILYGIDLLDEEQPDGVNDNPVRALESLQKMKEFARKVEVAMLPSHDPSKV